MQQEQRQQEVAQQEQIRVQQGQEQQHHLQRAQEAEQQLSAIEQQAGLAAQQGRTEELGILKSQAEEQGRIAQAETEASRGAQQEVEQAEGRIAAVQTTENDNPQAPSESEQPRHSGYEREAEEYRFYADQQGIATESPLPEQEPVADNDNEPQQMWGSPIPSENWESPIPDDANSPIPQEGLFPAEWFERGEQGQSSPSAEPQSYQELDNEILAEYAAPSNGNAQQMQQQRQQGIEEPSEQEQQEALEEAHMWRSQQDLEQAGYAVESPANDNAPQPEPDLDNEILAEYAAPSPTTEPEQEREVER